MANTTALEPLLDQLRAKMIERGERMTRPRQLVLQALLENEGHPSADEIVADVEKLSDSIHRASVYRNLEVLAELGIVRHFHATHGPTRYQLVTNHQEHIHLECRVCGVVLDASPHLIQTAVSRIEREEGFALDLSHVTLSGRCADCSA